MDDLRAVEPARLEGDARARFEADAAVILDRSRFRDDDGHAATVAELVAARMDLADDWAVLPLRSGTDALVRALRLVDVTPGVEVIVPDLAFHAVAASVLELGAVPVAVDIDPVDWNLDPRAVAAAIGPATGCVVAVDNYGTPVDLEALAAVTAPAGLPIVLDACESLGAHTGDPSAHADLVVTSFSFTKPVHAAGMGGALCGPADVVAGTARSAELLGPQLRLPELNAAYLVAAWPALDDNLAVLRSLHEHYARAGHELACTAQGGSTQSTRLHPALLAPDPLTRARIVAGLAERGIPTRNYFPSQSELLGLGPPPPIAGDIAARVFCLPGGAGIAPEAPERVTEALLASV